MVGNEIDISAVKGIKMICKLRFKFNEKLQALLTAAKL